MATHKSAEKRHRQSLKRREQNRFAKSTIRTSMKKVSALSEEGKRDEALAEAKAATSLLDKAMIHGTLHKNTVRRIISRMHKNINSATANN